MNRSLKITIACLIFAILASGVERYFLHQNNLGWTFYEPYDKLGGIINVEENNQKVYAYLSSILALNAWALFGISVVYNLHKNSKKKMETEQEDRYHK